MTAKAKAGDWHEETLDQMRGLVMEADPEMPPRDVGLLPPRLSLEKRQNAECGANKRIRI